MQIKDFRSKRQYFLFQVFGSSLSSFNTHSSITKAKVIFFIYFPQRNHTIRSILTSILRENLRSPPMEMASQCFTIPRTQEGAKFPKSGTYFVRNLQGNMFRGKQISWGETHNYWDTILFHSSKEMSHTGKGYLLPIKNLDIVSVKTIVSKDNL